MYTDAQVKNASLIIYKLQELWQHLAHHVTHVEGKQVPFIDFSPMLDLSCDTVFQLFSNNYHQKFDYYLKFYDLVNSAIADMYNMMCGKEDGSAVDRAIHLFERFWVEYARILHKNQYISNSNKEYWILLVEQLSAALVSVDQLFCAKDFINYSYDQNFQNILSGLDKLIQDLAKCRDVLNIGHYQEHFRFSKDIAATPGKVIAQNDLTQLICYKPKTKTHAIPIFLVPPCINKYYIFDLSKTNSFISFLVKNNFQVFVISWVNPDQTLFHKRFEDYIQEGVIDNLKHIQALNFNKINVLGYCIGGTMLATALAYLQHTQYATLISAVTFVTTMLDFTKPGRLSGLITQSTLALIKEEVEQTGYFHGKYLARTFNVLRAKDMIWSVIINKYFLGADLPKIDILYWNADSTNLSGKMYIFCLKKLYLGNILKEPNALQILGRDINLSKIKYPTFCLATQRDHIVPWKAAYYSAKLLGSNVVFCLSGSGHVAGVINPIKDGKYYYKINENSVHDSGSMAWEKSSKKIAGSWWGYWLKWLKQHSGEMVNAIDYSKMHYLEKAPGSYAMRRI
ncbi:PHA/PHB synthase family protein [Candidatus Sarmatiella mevalonica]|uniref:PHA/PHB synthase family protein n=1 Tax=Candidatus Sarmatiella mevalonica TaxID=2770581 RepID=UPI001921EFA9|nr:alpha/beta fold hydrolase [Candidatus Sarmatiella mevalonica]